MFSRNVIGFGVLITLIVASSCQDRDAIPAPPYTGSWPAIPDVANGDASTRILNLGRVLFYDKQLSADNTIACGSCHKQSFGFADNQSFSDGFNGKATLRNSMPVQNLAILSLVPVTDDSTNAYGSASNLPFAIGGLFWDGRESELKRMVLEPIVKHDEMGNLSLYDVEERIMQLPYYTKLFKEAFGEETQIINMEDRLGTALTLFVLSIKTSNSKYDQYINYRQMLTDTEMKGLALFEGKYNCNNCHQVDQIGQSSARFANIGLDMTYADNGLSLVTKFSGDDGKFRVPSLRNVEYTAPYMHDGRFATLEEVIQHYSEDIKSNANLNPDLKDEHGMARRMNISVDETKALIAFLKTLSDPSVLTNPNFADPFK